MKIKAPIFIAGALTHCDFTKIVKKSAYLMKIDLDTWFEPSG
ncbi:hypothetical protein M977_02762 [Buttiauxella gaviniae ATCC 51604]|uniref:Uncharacterized protein n=1 Tax=Buttiauxella gaviniae ATCC 51604 TaxID=1354253 RepID=A0A1B7HW79_9ENTR|nr:hypothetical protein M977_02762 [Buttiauxella gaviniae ATCC 51604]